MASRSADLRRTILAVGAPVAILTVAAAAFVATRIAMREVERTARHGTAITAQRAAASVDLLLREQRRSVTLLAATPTVVDRARAVGARARNLGLAGLPTAERRARYGELRTLESDAPLNRFLARVRDDWDAAEIVVTDQYGLVAATSGPTSDVVRSDEHWWQQARALGTYEGAAEYDQATGTAVVGLAARIDDPESGEPLGVLRAVLDLSQLARVLKVPGDTTVTAGYVVDSAGRILAAPGSATLWRSIPGAARIPLQGRTAAATLRPPGAPAELVASSPANRGRWWVVARQPAPDPTMALPVRRVVILTAGGLLAVIVALLWWLSSWLDRRVTRPVRLAGDIVRRIAHGDLSVSVTHHRAGSQEVRALLASVDTMVLALRDLVDHIRSASEDSAAMAQEISASTQQLSASTQEMANTCQSLTQQAAEEAETVRAAVGDATRIVDIATTLADGAREAAARSAALTDLASRHREQLIAGGEQLTRLADDLAQGAADAQVLANMSEEIQHFVKQARDIGVQTNMLALNAAIEASRAGGGDRRGFAVVADEVRQLATQASRAAGTTAETVRTVLTTLQATRARLSHLVEASTAVRAIAESAAGGLGEVVKAAAGSSAWTNDISTAATEVRRLVEGITHRLEVLAQGTEGVVAAAQQITASAQEQSASTEEIANAASQLAASAERLTEAVSAFRMLREAPSASRAFGGARG